MGEACGRHGEEEKCMDGVGGEIYLFEDPNLDKNVILKCISKEIG
jgi:hypothetical protein